MDADPNELVEEFLPGGLQVDPLLAASDRRDVAIFLLLCDPVPPLMLLPLFLVERVGVEVVTLTKIAREVKQR